MAYKVVAFKNVGNIRAAILAVACDEGHGNISKVITDRLKADPAISAQIKKSLKKIKK